jgi:hypothetical protein
VARNKDATKRMAVIEKMLFTIDGTINLILGLLLLIFPRGMVSTLGLPVPSTDFYVNLFGGVLVGIGLALFLQSYLDGRGITGLGLQGAVVINLCGAGVLLAWLLSGKLNLSKGGDWFLWAIDVLVLAIAVGEILFWFQKRYERQDIYGAVNHQL